MSNADHRFATGITWLLLAIGLIAAAVPARALVPLENVAAVTAGYQHTCALTTGGGVKCWGNNRYGVSSSKPITRQLF